jgi:hypothetical protein
MSHKKQKPKRKALVAQLADADARRLWAESDRDEADRRAETAEWEVTGLSQRADAFARSVLRAAGVNGNGDMEKIRRLCRGWLDS